MKEICSAGRDMGWAGLTLGVNMMQVKLGSEHYSDGRLFKRYCKSAAHKLRPISIPIK